MKLINLEQIKTILGNTNLVETIEAGFVAYSQDQSVVPPVGELIMKDPPGEVHIKYGYLKNDDYYVIKVASGFYENPKLDLPSSNGLMLLFSQKTGELLCVLLDEGYLTDLRTAIAGAIAAKYLAPRNVHCIGIVGTGIQAKMQLQQLAGVTNCRSVIVWGRSQNTLNEFQAQMNVDGFSIQKTMQINQITDNCNLIVTTTPSVTPLLKSDQIIKGTHITAIGADAPHKQELDHGILQMADLVVADSIAQCQVRGEIYKAIEAGVINANELVELGQIINGTNPGRINEDQITVADLTGVAVQDIQIAKAVYQLSNHN